MVTRGVRFSGQILTHFLLIPPWLGRRMCCFGGVGGGRAGRGTADNSSAAGKGVECMRFAIVLSMKTPVRASVCLSYS